MVSLRYALTAEDFANYSIYVHAEAPGKRKQLLKRFLPLIIAALVIFAINVATSVSAGSFDFSILIFLSFILISIVVSVSSTKPRLKKAALSFAADPENASVFYMTDYTFSETGMIAKDQVKESKIQWAAIVKKLETPDYIFLFLTSTSAYIIPKKVFRSEVQKEELDKLFKQFISFDAEVGHLVKG